MAPKVWLAAELEAMTPAQQDALFDASLVTDLSTVPSEFLQRVRERLEQRITETGSSSSS